MNPLSEGSFAERRAAALLAQVAPPPALPPESVERIARTLAAQARATPAWQRKPGWRWAVGGLMAASAFAAVSQTDLLARVRAAAIGALAPARPAASPTNIAPAPTPTPTPTPTPDPTPAPTWTPAPPLPARLAPAHAARPAPAVPVEPAREAAVAPASGGSLGEEAALLARAVSARNAGHAQEALAALDEHRQRFAAGSLAPDELVLRIEILLTLGRRADALRLLEALEPAELAALARSNELRALKGELLAEAGRCPAALDALDSALSGALRPEDEERARYAQVRCLARAAQPARARQAAQDYLQGFPDGPHAGEMGAVLKAP